MDFTDRSLKCSDCSNEFVFTAGEQLFFYDKQFKNDPKRCKLCKAKRAGNTRTASPNAEAAAVAALPLSRTETRTQCSACGLETTVPFRPTQGRPVLCRSCFQRKRVPKAVAAVPTLDSPAAQIEIQLAAAESALQQQLALQQQELAAQFTVAPPLAEAAPPASSEAITQALIAEAPVTFVADAEALAAQDLAPALADLPQA